MEYLLFCGLVVVCFCMAIFAASLLMPKDRNMLYIENETEMRRVCKFLKAPKETQGHILREIDTGMYDNV